MGKRDRVTPQKKGLARHFRRNMTAPERLLWQHIRCKKLGVKFLRQSVLYGYIADFYCARLRLIVEVDGACHSWVENRERDMVRDARFLDHGIRTVRFSAWEVLNRTAVVVGKLKRIISREWQMQFGV